MKIRLKESDLIRSIKLILEQESDTIEMTPGEYTELLKLVKYDGRLIPKLKQYRNKKIIITGTLNLSGLPVTSLSGVTEVKGHINVPNTQIQNLDGIKYQYAYYYNTPMKSREERIERMKLLAVADERRESGEWDEDDYVGNRAHALLLYLDSSSNLEIRYSEDTERLSVLKARLEELEIIESEYIANDRDMTDLVADIEVINDEIAEIENKADVYNLIPSGEHYEMLIFKVVGTDFDEKIEYCVGDESEIDESARDYVEGMIGEGENMFSKQFLEYHIDEDKVRRDAEDDYDYLVRESPESYFNEDEYELGPEQEKEKEELESKIAALEERKEQLEEYQNNLEHEIEEPRDYSDAYDKVQEQIDEIDELIDNIQDSIDNLTPEEPSEEQIEDKISELVDDAVRDPVRYLEDRGQDLMNWVNEKDLIDDVLRNDGYGIMNGYDGTYDTINYNGVEYYIMRIN